MDREHFDALTRLFSTRGSRRAALAATLGGVLLGQTVDPAEAGRKRKGKHHKRQRRDEDHDDDDNGQDEQCFPGTDCRPGRGRSNAGCDFSGSTTFRNRDVHGAILSKTNFTGADASGADLRGAVLSGACFVDADLSNATIDESTVLDGAIFCHTIMPDGSIDDTGCNRATSCCPTSPAPGGGQACQVNGDCAFPREICFDGTCQECWVCASGCVFTRIQQAVDRWPSTIPFLICPGRYRERVRIDRDLTVVGLTHNPSDVVLDGGGQLAGAAVLTVDAGAHVTVRNMTITGGKVNLDGVGGGVSNFGELTLQNVHVTDNSAEAFNGGGIMNEGQNAKLTLEDTLVTNNTATDGGGLSNGPGQATLRRGTRVEDNSATGAGGGMFNRGTLTLEGAVVRGNTADESGGGIFNQRGAVTLTQQTFVQENIAGSFGGGGIDNVAGSVSFIGEAYVNDNTANGGAGSGGGILNRGTVTSENRPIATLVVNNSPDDCVNAGSGTGCPA